LIYIKKNSSIEPTIVKVLNDSGLFTKVGELSAHVQNLAASNSSLSDKARDINDLLTAHAQNLTNSANSINETLNKRVGEMNETLDKKVGALTEQTEDIKKSHKSVVQMLRVPKERGLVGEIGLEMILKDQLPPDMFGIRQKILGGKIPDAHIKSTVGIICIDSKFPLDNYEKMVNSQDATEKESLKIKFIKDVENHLIKISSDYVNKQEGFAKFAFAYIPSEGVYYFLRTDAYDMLKNYARKGVIVTSPLFLTSDIELIKAGVVAEKLSEDAIKVRNDIIRLSKSFEELDTSWRVFYNTHFHNLKVKAFDVDQGYNKLRDEFGKISVFGNKQISEDKINKTLSSKNNISDGKITQMPSSEKKV
jgi:DNA recombination protein RmuC